MKPTSFFFLSILVISNLAFSQNYQPFRLNNIYEYVIKGSPNQELASFRIDSVNSLSNGDSVYFFNKRTFSDWPSPHRPNTDSLQNIFGTKMIKKQLGSYQFITAWNDTFNISTINNSWIFNKKRAITASSKKGFRADINDSIIDISLSHGKKIVLTKSNGLLEGITFVHVGYEGLGQVSFKDLIKYNGAYSPVGIGSTFALEVGDILGYSQYSYKSDANTTEKLIKVKVKSKICPTPTSSCSYQVEVNQKNFVQWKVKSNFSYIDTIGVEPKGLKGRIFQELSVIGLVHAETIVAKNYLSSEFRTENYPDYRLYIDSASKPTVIIFDGNIGRETYKYPVGFWSSDEIYDDHYGFPYNYSSTIVYYKNKDTQYGDSTELFSRILAVEENEVNHNSLLITPNPASDELKIQVVGFQNVKVLDLFGNAVIESYQPNLDISALSTGMYVAVVTTNDQLYHHKFLKR